MNTEIIQVQDWSHISCEEKTSILANIIKEDLCRIAKLHELNKVFLYKDKGDGKGETTMIWRTSVFSSAGLRVCGEWEHH